MTYWNPVVQYGVDRYADDLLAAGGAGLITPDITPEAGQEWIDASRRTGLDRIFLAAPTSSDERLRLIVENSTGFVYTVSTMGITGERAELDAAGELAALLRRHRCVRASRHAIGPTQRRNFGVSIGLLRSRLGRRRSHGDARH